MHPEWRGHSREGKGHADAGFAWLEVDRIPLVQFLESRSGIFQAEVELFGSFSQGGRKGSRGEILVDEIPDLPDEVFILWVQGPPRC